VAWLCMVLCVSKQRWVKVWIDVEDSEPSVEDEQYARVANAIWALMNATELQFSVEHDGLTSPSSLEDDYENQPKWPGAWRTRRR
jgi:hypothetical protein